jgi:DNA polymerase-1
VSDSVTGLSDSSADQPWINGRINGRITDDHAGPDVTMPPVSHTVHLIDASPYVFRAWFSLPASMTAPDGHPVNAVYGFLTFLLRYLAEEQPTHLALAFDESLTTCFRNDLYPDYKAQRELPPEELEQQFVDCRRVAEALGAACFADVRYEADDFIGTLCPALVAKGHRVVVTTVDKDLAQLVSEHVQLYDWAAGKRYGPAEVVEKLGVRPEQVPDYLGLMGDAVDNIPGVAGVGAKTARALLEAYPDLDALYADLPNVADLPIRGARTLAEKLRTQREIAYLSRTLATLATDAPASAHLRKLAWKGADASLVDPLFELLGFGRVRERVPRWR